MGTIANAKVTHYYNCYNGYFVGCLLLGVLLDFGFAGYLGGTFGTNVVTYVVLGR